MSSNKQSLSLIHIPWLSITTNPTRIEFECLDRWDQHEGVSVEAVGREEPSCGLFQGSHQLIRPHQPPRPGVDSIPGRKKRPGGCNRLRNSYNGIGPAFHITCGSAVHPANRRSLGGSWDQFPLRRQWGVVDSSLRADSVVPLAHAVVALIPAGPCCQGNPGDPPVTRTNPRGPRSHPGSSRWRDEAEKVSRTCAVIGDLISRSCRKIRESSKKYRIEYILWMNPVSKDF